MGNYPAKGVFILTCLVVFIFLISCSPKYVVRGRVVDAETRQPIKGAAVAIRWYAADSGRHSADLETLDAVQALSDEKGFFLIPEYPNKKYVLGVYKNGYICWSSRDVFCMGPKAFNSDEHLHRENHQVKDGMQIDLRPLKDLHARNLHAGFAVMVAGEATDTDTGPFNEAIQAEYKLWRENLRKDFQKQLGVQ
ncbi:MAG: carboxypeptidase-like regulatory domain-containing protein [Desulfobacterales bacterium]